MQKKIKSALISVFYKEGLDNIIHLLNKLEIKIYSTGGTRDYIEKLGITCIAVETLTTYPSILGGRVKTLHPALFGGILAKRADTTHISEMKEFNIPEIDLVVVDLYPFEETLKNTVDEELIIEKIDVGGPSMLRAAAKNYKDVVVIASKKDYNLLEEILKQQGETTLAQRRMFATKAFDVCTEYDNAISNYFNSTAFITPFNKYKKDLRYGENPHQHAAYYGNLEQAFIQLHGKELSYNNLVDVDAAINLIMEFRQTTFAIIKHTNVCGIAQSADLIKAWNAALAGDPESAFGGVLVCNKAVDAATAMAINEIFFEVLIAPSFNNDALLMLTSRKNRIILQHKESDLPGLQFKSLLNGVLIQENDNGNYSDWKEVGGRESGTEKNEEKEDLVLANIICKHLKSNAIALVKDKQLIGKGCGQTSRIDALRNAIDKAKQFNFNLDGAVLASDAFFPFDDCVKIAHAAGIIAFIQPGGSIRDVDSIEYCKKNKMAMVITGMRHFKH